MGARKFKKATAAKSSAAKSRAPEMPGNAVAGAMSSRALSTAISKRKTIPQRLDALSKVSLGADRGGDRLQAILDVLRDVNEPVELRLGALQSLQAASFSVATFSAVQGDYQAVLRQVAQDTDPKLREEALDLLATQKDGFAQKKLLEGLQDSTKALVSPEKALQLLGYDAHAAGLKAARAIIENPPNPVAKQEALRLLASDPSSVPIFEKTLLDKDELRENRQISASALHSLAPEKLQDLARNIVLDKGDYDDIKATSLTALSQFGDSPTLAVDKTLQKSVDRLKAKSSTMLQQSAGQFLSKYGG